MKRILSLFVIVLLASGCAQNRIIDYDPENDGYEDDSRFMSVDESFATKRVVVADDKQVMVEAFREPSIWDDQSHSWLQVWGIFMSNSSTQDRCVAVRWKLMDFQYNTDHPTYVFVPGTEVVKSGEMIQTTMVVGDVVIAPLPSGYADAIDVIAPNMETNNPLDRCTFNTEDGNVIER